jgi:hypothetical protein
MAKPPRNESKTNLINQHYFDMGAIKLSEIEIEKRSRTYAEILSRESAALTKYCAICTKPRILIKDGVFWQCDQCVYKKAFQQRMEHVRKSLELNND